MGVAVVGVVVAGVGVRCLCCVVSFCCGNSAWVVVFMVCMFFLRWFFFNGFHCVVVSCGLWVSYRLYLGVNVVLFLCFPVVFVNIVGEIGVCFFILLLFS